MELGWRGFNLDGLGNRFFRVILVEVEGIKFEVIAVQL